VSLRSKPLARNSLVPEVSALLQRARRYGLALSECIIDSCRFASDRFRSLRLTTFFSLVAEGSAIRPLLQDWLIRQHPQRPRAS